MLRFPKNPRDNKKNPHREFQVQRSQRSTLMNFRGEADRCEMMRGTYTLADGLFFSWPKIFQGAKNGAFFKLHIYGVNMHKMVSTQTWIWVILGDFFLADSAKFKTTIKSAGESPRKLHRPPQRVPEDHPRTDGCVVHNSGDGFRPVSGWGCFLDPFPFHGRIF